MENWFAVTLKACEEYQQVNKFCCEAVNTGLNAIVLTQYERSTNFSA